MKIPRPPHNWSVTPKQAIAIQKRLAQLVREVKPPRFLRYIAGVDAAFSPDNQFCLAVVVLWDRENQVSVEQHLGISPLKFPYIPGLLTFREAPAIIKALRNLQRRPDVLLCDGQGIAHPRRLGIACHLGLLTDLPAIGCAKSRLIGSYQEPDEEKGARAPLLIGQEQVGSVIRTRENVKPVFVSIGHKIDLPTAEQIVLTCATRYRLPEPTRLADQLVAAAKRQTPNAKEGSEKAVNSAINLLRFNQSRSVLYWYTFDKKNQIKRSVTHGEYKNDK
jgi:deoxyribonuclease V